MRLFVCSLVMVFSVCLSYGDVLRLGRYYTDGMVLQRDKPNVIRGWADVGADIHVSFAGQKATTTADERGQWDVTLEPMPGDAKGKTINVKSSMASKDITIDNVVVGDVIIFGRQTTIDITLGRDKHGRDTAAAYKNAAGLRSIRIQTIPAGEPQHDLASESTAGWHVVDAKHAENMSAAAFYLGAELSKQVDVPIGIIDVNMGYHFPIAWLRHETILETKQAGHVEGWKKKYQAYLYKEPFGKHKEILTEDPIEDPLYPAAAYNAVIAPLRGISVKGLITQLGNDYPYMHYEKLKADGKLNDRELMNAAYVKTYEIRKTGFRMESDIIPALPAALRRAFGGDSVPFAFVNPPSSDLWTYAVHNREMRELQRLAGEAEAGVDIILPGMDAIPFSGQPRDERLLAERSLHWVLGTLYDDAATLATGPVLDRIESDGLTATVYFKEGTATGLAADEGGLSVFEVADVDAEYVPATAKIVGDTVQLTSDEISRIFYVRYNWKEIPVMGLVNAAGLPAIPFRTEKTGHQWFVRHEDDDLPSEYYTPANEWTGGSVTLINAQLAAIGYPHFSGWVGPIGIKAGPFGPNMGVSEVKSGSPAEGKLFVGDMIYSVNGEMLGDEEEMTMSAAITEAEATDGRLVLGVHRDGTNLDVEVQLAVLGRYSATSPWNCLKSEKIVANLEAYLAARGAPIGFLDSDAMFLLGAGSPEYQWMVRKTATSMPGSAGHNWGLGYRAQYLSEYFLSTGDKRVLPQIQALSDEITAMQIREDNRRNGGWYGRGVDPRGYPAMSHTGISAMLGLALAKECGVDVDAETFERGLAYLARTGAPVGQIIYGDVFRDEPRDIDPQQLLAGRLSTENGKVPEAAVLYDILGDRRSAHLNSHISTHAWYSTYGGHGGHFWDQYWTPLGSAVQSKDAYIYFMKGHRWFREMNRMFDGSHITGGKAKAATGLALVVPHRRLRILGAPKSPFSPDAPAELQDALSAYYARDYARAEELSLALIANKAVDKNKVPTVSKLAEESRRMLNGIEADLARMDHLIQSGQLHEAGLMLASLQPVIAEDDARLAAISEELHNGTAREADKERYVAALAGGVQDDEMVAESADDLKRIQEEKAAAAAAAAPPRTWEAFTTSLFFPKNQNSKPDLGKAPAEEVTSWHMKILETRDNAPDDWMTPGFDDGEWVSVTHPVSWHLNHTALHRTTFNVSDPDKFDLLKFKCYAFRQQDIAIYLNGELIGRVNNIEGKTGTIEHALKPIAADLLKKGENTLAVATRQNWRWGMLFMNVYNNGGFDFMLFGRLAEDR